jgi:hypothetical protein
MDRTARPPGSALRQWGLRLERGGLDAPYSGGPCRGSECEDGSDRPAPVSLVQQMNAEEVHIERKKERRRPNCLPPYKMLAARGRSQIIPEQTQGGLVVGEIGHLEAGRR